MLAQKFREVIDIYTEKNSKSEFGRDLNLKMQKTLETLFAKERDGRILLEINNGI